MPLLHYHVITFANGIIEDMADLKSPSIYDAVNSIIDSNEFKSPPETHLMDGVDVALMLGEWPDGTPVDILITAFPPRQAAIIEPEAETL